LGKVWEGKIHDRLVALSKRFSSFNLIREDLARKAALACAVLWNFYMLVSSLIAYFILHALQVCLYTCGIFRTPSFHLLTNAKDLHIISINLKTFKGG